MGFPMGTFGREGHPQRWILLSGTAGLPVAAGADCRTCRKGWVSRIRSSVEM